MDGLDIAKTMDVSTRRRRGAAAAIAIRLLRRALFAEFEYLDQLPEAVRGVKLFEGEGAVADRVAAAIDYLQAAYPDSEKCLWGEL